MTDFYVRDPEEVGPEHPDDLNARMNLIEARHEYEGDGGPCTAEARKFCYDHNIVDECKPCGLQESSVMHIDDFKDYHDHGGYDCMCFEDSY